MKTIKAHREEILAGYDTTVSKCIGLYRCFLYCVSACSRCGCVNKDLNRSKVFRYKSEHGGSSPSDRLVGFQHPAYAGGWVLPDRG